MNFRTCLAVAGSLIAAVSQGFSQHTLRDETNLHLLLNSELIASARNVELIPGMPKKHPGNPIMVEDKPWEVRYGDLYPNIVFDPFEKFYKGWFGPYILCESTAQTPPAKRGSLKYLGDHAGTKRESGLLYGTSHDGKLWNKPLLALNPWDGDAKTNILLRGPHGAGVLRDSRDRARRYKVVYKNEGGLATRTSPDGIRWSEPLLIKNTERVGDSHNTLFWKPDTREFVVLAQLKDGSIGRIASKDFRNWSKVTSVLKETSPDLAIHALPVLKQGSAYVGFPAIHDKKMDRLHTELAWSADTVNWQRIAPGTPFVNTGKDDSHDRGSVYCGSIVAMNNGVRLFYSGSNGPRSGWRKGSLNLAELGVDRFAGQQAGKTPGTIALNPMPYRGGQLQITADIDQGGYVLVSSEDKEGNNIIESTRIEKSGTDMPIPATIPKSTKELTLRFKLQNATLYSIRFR